jgi:hypothetical protein
MAGAGPLGAPGSASALPADDCVRGRRWVSEFAQAGDVAAPRWSSPVWLARGRCGAREAGAERRVRAALAEALELHPPGAPRTTGATITDCHAALQRVLQSAAPPETWRRLEGWEAR